MKASADPKVQDFIIQIMTLDDIKFKIMESLREIAFNIFPKIKERMMYGGILLTLNEDVGGIFVYTNHVSFEFSNGFEFDDPGHFLEGKGKFRRHLKFSSAILPNNN